MKRAKQIVLMIFVILIYSCRPFYQLYKIEPDSSMKLDKRFILFENDTLYIAYYFWAEKGILTYSIFNKTKKPLYVDWKKSSYILNFEKLNFWEDNSTIRLTSVSETDQKTILKKHDYKSTLILPYQNLYQPNSNTGKTESQTNSTSVTSSYGLQNKIERITFIAPNSYVSYSSYNILTKRILYKDKKTIKKFTQPNDSMIVYQKKYLESESPIKFTVFLTFSSSENFSNEFYVNNKFFLSEIIELRESEFNLSDNTGNANCFYIQYPSKQSLNHMYETYGY